MQLVQPNNMNLRRKIHKKMEKTVCSGRGNFIYKSLSAVESMIKKLCIKLAGFLIF